MLCNSLLCLVPWTKRLTLGKANYKRRNILLPITRFMGPTWAPSGADRTQVGPVLAPWTLLSGTHWQFLYLDTDINAFKIYLWNLYVSFPYSSITSQQSIHGGFPISNGDFHCQRTRLPCIIGFNTFLCHSGNKIWRSIEATLLDVKIFISPWSLRSGLVTVPLGVSGAVRFLVVGTIG